MIWHRSWRADPRVRQIADRHYSRQKIGAEQFVAPGRCLVLVTERADAAWITSWPIAQYVHHEWAGAWTCALFRNETKTLLSSELIRDAVLATRAEFGDPPPMGFVTFVDERKVRRKRDPGRCYLQAGWHYAACGACEASGSQWQQVFHPATGSFSTDRTAVCADCGGDGHARTKTERLRVLRLLPSEIGEPIAPLGSQMHLWRHRDAAVGS
jgi:hypothetical protein